MENWKQKPLSQVVSRWIRGTTLNRSRADYYTKTPGPESLPWARVGDMKEGLLCETENYLTKEGVDQIPWLIVPEGAVLLSVSGTIGKSAIAGCDLVVNQAIQAMIFDEGQILPEYACFYLEFYRPWLIERANAVTVPNLTKEQLSGIPVVFPCLEEQQVIVDQLKRARRLMQRSRRSEDTLNRILENAFGKIARSALKEGKISRDEEFLSPVLRPIWVSLKTRVLPAEHETDMFVPVLSQTEQVSFIKIVERTKEIRKRLHKIQQLEIRYFKSMLSLAFTAGLTEGFRKQEVPFRPGACFIQGELRNPEIVRNVSQPKTKAITDWQSRIPQELQSLFTMLSDFQMEILRIYAQSQEAIPVHTVFKQIHKKGILSTGCPCFCKAVGSFGLSGKDGSPETLYGRKRGTGTVQVIPLPYKKYQIPEYGADIREV